MSSITQFEQRGLLLTQTEAGQSPKEPKLILRLEVEGRLPSWNEILGMEHWQRYKVKSELAADFLSALRASEDASSTRIISVKNITSIFADTLERYLRTQREKRKLKSLKKKLEAKSGSTSESKSTLFEKVPF